MMERVNLADPDFEPSDEQLMGLSSRAFAGVRQKHELALEKLRREIAEAREAVLREVERRLKELQDSP